MQYYLIMTKSYNINEAGDEVLEDAGVLAVKTSLKAATEKIEELRESYKTDEFIVEDTETSKEDHGIIITTSDDNPGFYICIYVEVLDDEE